MSHKLLYPVSVIYGFLATVNRYLYQAGIKKSHRLVKPVVSVGNLSTGGTGKTPITIAIARYFKNIGKKPVVLSRGYKRKSTENIICNPDLSAFECGDEPLLMAKKGIDVVVGKDRIKSANLAVKNLNPDVFILDDGFQHHRIDKDFNILVVDATKPFWEDRLLPVGRLREPADFYRYADCLLITRLDRIQNKDEFIDKLEEFKKPFFTTQEEFKALYNPEGETLTFSQLTGKDVVVMAGLGNNQQFFHKISKLSETFGFKISQFLNFPDHYQYSNFNPDTNKIYITTEKDIVKLNAKNIYAVEYNLKIEDRFYETTLRRLSFLKER